MNNRNKLMCHKPYSIAVTPPPTPTYISNDNDAVADTGASSHYLHPKYKHLCTNIQPANTNSRVLIANGYVKTSDNKAILPLTAELNPVEKKVNILDNLQKGTLISIGQLCNDDCVVLFRKYHATILKNGKVVIQGHHNPTNDGTSQFLPYHPIIFVVRLSIINKPTA